MSWLVCWYIFGHFINARLGIKQNKILLGTFVRSFVLPLNDEADES